MNPILNLVLQTGEEISFEIYLKDCPVSAKILLEAVDRNFLDGQKLERVVPDFVVQPWYDDSRKDDKDNITIKSEITDRKFVKYSVGLAGDGKGTSCPCCLFFCTGTDSLQRLNGSFTNIGTVIRGQEILDRIEKLPLRKIDNPDNVTVFEPVEPVIIKHVYR